MVVLSDDLMVGRQGGGRRWSVAVTAAASGATKARISAAVDSKNISDENAYLCWKGRQPGTKKNCFPRSSLL